MRQEEEIAQLKAELEQERINLVSYLYFPKYRCLVFYVGFCIYEKRDMTIQKFVDS
jgi:hypothetical protein